jgi:hypothetical protein
MVTTEVNPEHFFPFNTPEAVSNEQEGAAELKVMALECWLVEWDTQYDVDDESKPVPNITLTEAASGGDHAIHQRARISGMYHWNVTCHFLFFDKLII